MDEVLRCYCESMHFYLKGAGVTKNTYTEKYAIPASDEKF